MEARSTPTRWTVLARIPAPVGSRAIWKAMLDKTEHPERYNPNLTRAQVLDHDPTTVLRRTWPRSGEPFHEWVRHTIRERRVEYRREGADYAWAQVFRETPDGGWLVYEVDDAAAAETRGGICPQHATRTLSHLLAAARSL